MILLLNRVLALCEQGAVILANSLLALILFGGIVNIVAREFFGKGIIWIFPWTIVLFAWIVFLGYFIVFRRKSDVTMQFFVKRLGAAGRTLCNAIAVVCSLVVNAVILSQIGKVIELRSGSVEIVEVPAYVVSFPLFFSAGLIILSVFESVASALGRAEKSNYQPAPGE